MDDKNTSSSFNSSTSNNSSSLPTQQLYPTTPFASYYSSSAGAAAERRLGVIEDSVSGSHGFPAVASQGLEPGAFVHGRGEPSELDLDAHDCESEDGIGVLEEPAKPAAAHCGSGSKRSRAAEVHNLSEKRRRSRINEKMKALQNLIPNSNKTDKASMLDEAIEYLKQLQLQVQMLSMRNGLNLHPLYMPGPMQPFQSSQLCMGFGVDNGSAMNMGAGMLPLNLDSSARNSYGQSNRCTSSHQSIILPSIASMTAPGTSFGLESSQTHNESFQLPAEIFTEDMVPEGQLDSGRTTRNLQENEMKSMAATTALHFGGQASSLEDTDHLDRGFLASERSEDMLSKDPDNQIFIQHFLGLQTGSRSPPGDVKAESPEF